MRTATCRTCGKQVRYLPSKFVWQHTSKGADHAPIPTGGTDGR